MEYLPEELLGHIYGHLEAHDIAHLEQVSRSAFASIQRSNIYRGLCHDAAEPGGALPTYRQSDRP